jgi:hypothetical protein
MSKHESWLIFEPKEGENLKTNECYYERLEKARCEIPKDIIHQWIFPHFNEPNSNKNYSWINLDTAKFELVYRPISFFEELNIIKVNEKMVNDYSMNNLPYWHRDFWKKNATWETPPIVIEVNSFAKSKPVSSEIEGDYQLVEGHNRLGTLKLLLKDDRIPISEKHKVWILSKK